LDCSGVAGSVDTALAVYERGLRACMVMRALSGVGNGDKQRKRRLGGRRSPNKLFVKTWFWVEDYLDCGGVAGSADTALAVYERGLRACMVMRALLGVGNGDK